MSRDRKLIGPLLVLASVLLAACASTGHVRKASEAAALDNWDAAVYHYLEALAQKPQDFKLRMELQRARMRAGEQHFRRGMRFAEAGDLQRAAEEYELAVQLDPTHQYAEVELKKARKDLEVLAQEGGTAKLEAMKKAASEMKVKPPVLNPTSTEPISLSFPNPTNIKDIYHALGQSFGINILFDPKLRDNKITIELKDVDAQQALETLMQAGGHFYKVLDNRSLIVVEDSPQNRRDYEDLVVKTFFLSNADVKDINNTLRTLIDARRIAVNEQLNAVVIRDTADKVAIAERLIQANDKAKAEVLVDVELIQVDSSKMHDIGAALSTYTFPITMDPSSITGSADSTRIPLPDLGRITRSMWGTVVPSISVNLIKSAGEAETLAQPQLRITEGQKANLVIGDRVPIPTTTFNTTQTIGGNVVPITAFQYTDVGIQIELEPRVHHNNEVTLTLKVEVSELGENVTVAQGQSQPKITTRTISSVIRLKDGETSLLAGLIKLNRRESRGGVPFLSDIPVIGGLFRSNSSEIKRSDLVLTLTPHIIRNPDITEEDLAPLWVGTENRITIFGNSPRLRSAVEGGPFSEADAPPQYTPEDQPPDVESEQVEPETSQEPESASEPETPQGDRRRLVFPPRRQRRTTRNPQDNQNQTPEPLTEDAASLLDSASSSDVTSIQDLEAASLASPPPLLSELSFYPARLPVVVGAEGLMSAVLDAGSNGVAGPVHLAYDPARLHVTRVEGGRVQCTNGDGGVKVSHTPALGWITLVWGCRAGGSSTVARLWVSPQSSGELPVILAGPIGEITSEPAAVLGLPGGPQLHETLQR